MKNVILLTLFLILVFSSCKKQGCTDPNANNYNSSANEDNGNCTYSLMDIEGNSYGAKTIGNQIWMTENLKVKKYSNGDAIPQVQDPLEWKQLTTGAWCYYENDPSKGILYNWYAVNNYRCLAPSGYHIPQDAEWTTLENFLGGNGLGNAGEKMKSTSGWNESGQSGNGTNTSGFNGLPGGRRDLDGSFNLIGELGFWWSNTSADSPQPLGSFAWPRYLHYNSDDVIRDYAAKVEGLSVRCVKD